MLTTPFLTDLDSRAAIKGSRDPLGIQQIWTRMGRHVVGNLTTASNSVRNFTTVILGYYFAEQLAEELGPGAELATFLKWEQLAAYSRAIANHDFEIRGTERVRKNLSEGSKIFISDDSAHQILSNQKVYGLWGLYTMAARASDLIEGSPSRLTPATRELVDSIYVPTLGPQVKRICDALKQKISTHEAKKTGLIESIGKVLQPQLLPKEREFFRDHLLYGGPRDSTDGRQQQLASLLEETLDQQEFTWSPRFVEHLASSAAARDDSWHPLAYRLRRIRAAEFVLAPAAALFTYLLGQDDDTVTSVAHKIREALGSSSRTVNISEFRELRSEIGVGEPTTGDRWVSIAEALSIGDYDALVRLLIEQNKSAMATRGGAPWIEIENEKLSVRVRDEQGSLPKESELASMWRFPYFLDSLRSVAEALKEA